MMLASKLVPHATRADLEQLPPTWRGEIIEGTLYAFPRPRAPHSDAEGMIVADLKLPFQRRRGGPGGWWILPEPGIELPGAPEIAPDVAGWRREKLPQLPKDEAITVVPDWVCEILSPSTASYDNIIKRRFYAQIGVGYLWYVDPRDRTLRVSRLEAGKWVELGVFGADEKVRAEPFEAVEVDLAAWWEAFEAGEDSQG